MKINTKAIRVEMAKRDWNYRDLALNAGLAYTTLISVMNGSRTGNIKTVSKISKCLVVDINKILIDEE